MSQHSFPSLTGEYFDDGAPWEDEKHTQDAGVSRDAKDAGTGNIIELRSPVPSEDPDSQDTVLYSYPETIDLCGDSDIDIQSDSEDELTPENYMRCLTPPMTRMLSGASALGHRGAQALSGPENKRKKREIEVEALPGRGIEQDEKKFRINAKSFANTYPQSGDLTKEHVNEWYKKKGAIECVVALEQHQDGTPHIHVYAKFPFKLNIKSSEHFDIDGHHGNYTACKSKEKWVRYIKKAGDYLELDLPFDADDYEQSTVKKNYEGYLFKKNFKRLKKLIPITWPLQITDEHKTIHWMNKGTFENKKRHWWIVGVPDTGKTTYINRITRGMKVWWPSEDYPFEGYEGQELVVYDDRFPTFSELSDVANEHLGMKPVYGKTRYTKVYWEEDVYINIIVLNNVSFEDKLDVYSLHLDAMRKRFNVINVSKLF